MGPLRTRKCFTVRHESGTDCVDILRVPIGSRYVLGSITIGECRELKLIFPLRVWGTLLRDLDGCHHHSENTRSRYLCCAIN